MIEVFEKEKELLYVSKDIHELEAYAEYLEGIFPDATQERIRWDKSIGFNVLKVDIGDDSTKKDFSDLLNLYASMR